MLPDDIANIIEVLNVPLKASIYINSGLKHGEYHTYQRLLTFGKGTERMRIHREARIHTNEPARLIVHLNVIIASEKSNWSRHYGDCVEKI